MNKPDCKSLYQPGIGLVSVERLRQITEKQYDSSHDDRHTDGALAVQAAHLLLNGTDAHVDDALDRSRWILNKSTRIRELTIAAALAVAELDRVIRRDSLRVAINKPNDRA